MSKILIKQTPYDQAKSKTPPKNHSQPASESKVDIMDLAPLLLTSSISEVIRSPMTPNVLRDLLPGHLGGLMHAHTDMDNGGVCLRGL
jgi:hypothetical protein